MMRTLVASILFTAFAAGLAGGTDPPRPRYELKPGEVLAYKLEVVWESERQLEWFTGTPVLEVKHALPGGGAALQIVGVLRGYAKLKGEEQPKSTGKEIWLGTRLRVDSRSVLGGRNDRQADLLPMNLNLLLRPAAMIFPALPVGSAREGSETDATLMETSVGGSPLGLPRVATTPGRKHHWREAKFASDHWEITTDLGFRTRETPPWKWQVRTVSRLDPKRGYLTGMTGTFEVEEAGRKRPPVRLSLRLLAGAEREAAIKQGGLDWQRIPAEAKPIEFLRERLANQRPSGTQKRPVSTAGVKLGQTFAFHDDGIWYRIEVSEIVNANRVRIRFLGSKETREVAVQSLVFLGDA